MLLIVFLLMEKNRFGRFIHLQAVNIWNVDGLFFCLRRNTWRRKYTMTYSREGNSESRKPQNSEFTVVSIRKCISAPPETHCCLDFLFSQQKKTIGNVKLPHCPNSKSKERFYLLLLQKCNSFLYWYKVRLVANIIQYGILSTYLTPSRTVSTRHSLWVPK